MPDNEPQWRARLREMIKLHEGLRLRPYQCTVGRWTIGYGHNLEAHGKAKPESITLEEAEKYLNEDMAAAELQCQRRLPYFGALDNVRRAVIIDMCFNLGINGLAGFRRMGEAITQNRYAGAASEMLDSKWATQVKTRAQRLSRMMTTGQWPEDIPA